MLRENNLQLSLTCSENHISRRVKLRYLQIHENQGICYQKIFTKGTSKSYTSGRRKIILEGWSEMQKGMVSFRNIYAYEQTCKNVYIWTNNIWGKRNTKVEFIELRKNDRNKLLDSNHIQVRRGKLRSPKILRNNVREQGLAIFFCERADSKYSKFRRPYSLCHDCETLPL